MRRQMLWACLVLTSLCLLAGCTEGAAEESGEMGTVQGQVKIQPTQFDQFYELYEQNREQGRPTLITTDSVLHTAHVLFDYTLRAAELQRFDQHLRDLTRVMMTSMATRAQEEKDRRYIMAPPPFGYDRVAAYFGVAQKLLDPNVPIPAIVRPLVDQEVALIQGAKGGALSPIMGVTEDYSQYKPRGHYTRNEQFQRFFRAMMWYGRAGFPISGEKAPGIPLTKDEARANTWAGIILSRALAATVVAQVDTREGGHPVTAMDLWTTIYRPTEFMVGTSDDLTPPEYVKLSQEIFGATLPGGWTDEAKAQTDRFIAVAIALRPPKIFGTITLDTEKRPPVALRLMGQRFVQDSAVFQQLVHPKVPDRYLPSGLDVMAVLGSPTAVEKLRQRGDFKYPHYEEQLTTLQKEIAAFDEATWQKTAYNMWLRTLRDLLTDSMLQNPQAPAWTRDPVWKDKQLNAGLGSWAELRHDTILYAKQSYTMVRSAMVPTPQRKAIYYVEPSPQVYRNLAQLMNTLNTTLDTQGVMPKELKGNYTAFVNLLDSLEAISYEEVPGLMQREHRTVTDEDRKRIESIGAILKQVETLPEPLRAQITGTEDAKAALIADVHTDPNHNQVLEVGVGKIAMVTVPVPAEGNQTVPASGPIFSYYEFAHPMDQRLTDAEWQTMLSQGKAPAPFILNLK
ncbi:MAG: DUF3160 domain-containing protein [Armatimonadota bacterium]